MKLLITGATGAAGSQIFRTAVADPSISKITVLARRAPLPEWLDIPGNNKTEVIAIQDFLNYPKDILPALADHDACVWALGKSSKGLTDEEYTRITYDYTLAAVRALEEGGVANTRAEKDGKPFQFVFVSGEGADQTEKSFMQFARIKGRTEKALLEIPTSSNIRASILRPAYFFPSPKYPDARQNIRGGSARFMDVILTPVMSNIFSSAYTPIEGLGKFAVEAAKGRWPDEQLFRNTRMKDLLGSI